MLYALGLVGALLVLALVLVGPVAGWAGVVAGTLVGLLVAVRFGAIGPEGAPYSRAFAHLGFQGRLLVNAAVGTVRVARSALAADVTVEPHLVKLRTRPMAEPTRAALALALGQRPGVASLDLGDDNQLVHALHEAETDSRALAVIEGAAIRTLEGRSP